MKYLMLLGCLALGCVARPERGERKPDPQSESELTRLADEHHDAFRREMALACDELAEQEFKDFDELYTETEKRFNAAYEGYGKGAQDVQTEMKSRLKKLSDAKAVFQELAKGYRK